MFGDLQEGSEGFNREEWDYFLDEFKSALPNAVCLGLGDYQDWLRPSMRARLQGTLSGDLSAVQQLETLICKDQDRFIKEYMEPLSGHCIGIHAGHHEYELLNGGSTSMRLASALKAPYLGWIASTRLVLEPKCLKKPKSGKRGYVFTMVSTHGSGGGKTPTGDVRALCDLANSFVCDQIVRGHSCKAIKLFPYKRHIVRRRGDAGAEAQVPHLLNVGGFCDGFTDGWSTTYAEKAGYSPQPKTWGIIKLKLVQRKQAISEKGLTLKHDKLRGHTPTLLSIENTIKGLDVMSNAYQEET